MDIHAIDYHRNGISGEGFYVTLFTDDNLDGPFVGVTFHNDPTDVRTAVLSVNKLAEGDIAFGSNSWRGDRYHSQIMERINRHEADILAKYGIEVD